MLYFAPINIYGNFAYRHLLLNHGADFVFSEVILINKLKKALQDDKLKIIKEDIPKTIFQIGVSSKEEIEQGINILNKHIPDIKEININMGCPQSSMKAKKMCGGLLHDIELMGKLAKKLSNYDFIASSKIRLGTDENNIKINEYLSALNNNCIKKVYIHARPLRYGYNRPCLYEYLKDIENRFPDMELIINGDIDSPQSVMHKNIMIGRAALSNPFIFEDIKNNRSYHRGPYNPIIKDPYIIHKNPFLLSQKKIDIINEFLDIAITHDLKSKYTILNLSYLCKGITGFNKFLKSIRNLPTKKVKNEFNNWIK